MTTSALEFLRKKRLDPRIEKLRIEAKGAEQKAQRAASPTGFALNFLKGIKETGQEIGKSFARFPLSAGEAIPRLILPKAREIITPPQKIPGLGALGEIETLQSAALRKQKEGVSPQRAIGEATVNVLIDEPLGLAVKPVFLAGGIVASKSLPFFKKAVSPLKTAVKDLIKKRYGELQTGLLDSRVFRYNLEQTTTKAEREAIPFIREGTDVPKALNRPDLETIVNAERKAESKLSIAAKQVGDYLDEAHEFLVKEVGDDIGFVEDFVPRLWDIPKAQNKAVVNWFATIKNNPHLKKRVIPTIKEGVEKFNLKPKTLDVSELIGIYDQWKVKTIANSRFAKGVMDLTDEAGEKLIQRADKAPKDWVFIDHSAMRKPLGLPAKTERFLELTEEAQKLIKNIGLTIGRKIPRSVFGRATNKVGEFALKKPPQVRFRKDFTPGTVPHEIGHYIDSLEGLSGKLGGSGDFWIRHKNELFELTNEKRIAYKGIPGTAGGKKLSTYWDNPEEQIAELVRDMFIDPKRASKLASKATKEITELILNNPKIKEVIGFDFATKAQEKILQKTQIITKLPVKVHPEIAHEMNVIFQNPFDAKSIRAMQAVQAFLKKTQLSISFFHHVALTEVAIPIAGFRKTLKLWNPVKIYNALKKGQFEIFEKIPVAKDGLRHGLQLGALEDVQRTQFRLMLEGLEKLLTKVRAERAGATIRKANDIWDTALWDYYHNGLKLNAYETLVQKELKKNPTINPSKIKEEIAQFINDTFGGQAWELLGKTPRWRQVMQWTLLSPDWTLSTIRQALAPTGIGAVHAETKFIRQKTGAEFWLKAGLYFYGAMNVWNYVNSKRHLGEGRWMWENDPGHKTLVFLGFDEDGRKQYLRWGKQFRELPEFFIDPIKKFGGKLSPVVQQIFVQTTGKAPSGFRTPLAEEFEAGKSFIETLPARGKELLAAPTPFAIRGAIKSKSILTFAFPVSKGLSKWEGRQFFKEAIKNKDIERMKEVYKSLVENNLDAEETYKQSLAEIKRERTIDNKIQAEKLIKELKTFGKEEGIQLLKELRNKGTLTPEIEEQMLKLLKGQGKVKKQREALGIQ